MANINTFSDDAARRTQAAVRGYEASLRNPPPLQPQTSGGRGREVVQIWARIDSAVRDGFRWRWSYNWTEIYKTAVGLTGNWAVRPGGISSGEYGRALNTAEWINDTTGQLGNGASLDNLEETDIEPVPVPSGLPVLLTWVSFGQSGEGEFWMTVMHGLDGGCGVEAQGEGEPPPSDYGRFSF